MPDAGALEQAIEAGDIAMISDFLAHVPQGIIAPATLTAATSPRLSERLWSINVIAARLAWGPAPRLARPLAAAVHAVALRHLDDPELKGSVTAEWAGAAADALASALAFEGDHEAIVALVRAAPAYLRGRTNGYWEMALRLRAVTALIELDRFEEAEQALDALAADGAAAEPNYLMVRARLTARLRSATELAVPQTAAERTAAAYKRAEQLLSEADATWKQATGTPVLAQLLSDADAAGLAQSLGHEEGPDTAKAIRRLIEEPHRLEAILGSSGTELSIWRKVYIDIASDLRDPARGHDATFLSKSLPQLLAARAWFQQNGQREDARDILWVIHLCQKRLNNKTEALATLRDLASQLESERYHITDPLRRGASSAGFPHLFACMAELCIQQDDPRGLLDASEAAKGRTLADLLTHRNRAASDERVLRLGASEVEGLTQALGIHYLTFLIDEEKSFAALVTKAGRWHKSLIPLGRKHLIPLARAFDPDAWTPNLFGEAIVLTVELAPFFSWLEPLLKQGEIARNDHIVYSADEHLHQFPLHAVDFCGEPVVACFALTRVHGVAGLRLELLKRPIRSLALFVPTSNEGNLAAKCHSFAATMAILADHLPTARQESYLIDAAYAAALRASDTLVHITAHGDFPEETTGNIIDPNPYVSAGLLLAKDGKLPVREAAWPAGLTPQLVLESANIDLTNAHITLEGCVSGLAKEGIGGDALGLEWALLAKGAASVLATHWHVHFDSAAAFSQHFYKTWLGKGRSRVDAWREATLALRPDARFSGSPLHWAGFSLTGDWR